VSTVGDRKGEAAAPRLELRPATSEDRELLFRIYASTRADELAVVGWPQEVVEAFLRQQFEAQDTDYRARYVGAAFDVIVLDGQPVGRLYQYHTPSDTNIMDIAVLPQFRGRGIGSLLVGDVLAAAAARGASVSIHVERNNPALAWYQRLGFTVVEDLGIYLFLRWWPAETAGP
jgi:ribosomal protein S18 acetylase RimI-like enzyme